MILVKREKFFRVYIMQIDYALILGAGLGTRMGEIGKKIPKILWPIYFKTMLELQINYCEELGIKKIYLNTHFLHDEIIHFLKTFALEDKVIVLHEEILLDSGGAIHNLAVRPEVSYHGNLLLVNGDQFLFFDKDYWEKALKRLALCRAVLFGIHVDKNSSYNQTVTKNRRLIDIKKNTEKKENYVTYSGLGLLNLNGLRQVPGISKFFETVANYKTENVEMLAPEIFEYWDFGTSEIYKKNILKLKGKSERDGLVGQFLKRHLAFNGSEELFVDTKLSAIDLDRNGCFEAGKIHARGIYQEN